MTFTFRFTAILELRRRERDQAAVSLSRIDKTAGRLDQQRQIIARQRESLREAHRNLRSGIISMHEVKSRTDFDDALRHADAQLVKEREALELELKNAHDKLIVAQQEVTKFEKLQQLQQSRHHDKMRHRQEREYDTIHAARQAK